MEGEPLLDDDFEVIKFGSKPRFDSKRPDPRNTSSQPTRNFMLSNMFDGFSIEPDELQEIVKDVVSECERFGHVTSAVPMLSADGILIIFEDAACAQNAFRIMNNRWFDKRQIQASYLAE
ncbi:MAG: hypothetical protein EZS28_054997 [Streblomastix strix]|uniref:RRM domain-containing protein n=1 Tax=Streblomastix strix TaxID=222440 RepID=A0A5J4Q8H3_9EUKA|nr:MAG: hypothetical protein EZS28_054997 [Streblomastix strix]